jgi:hypothetical protein
MYFLGAKGLPEPKNGIWGPTSVWSCDTFIDWKSHVVRKNILLGVQKAKISLPSPKTEFGAQNQYARVIYPSTSIENFTCSKKKYTFGGQIGKNKPSEPKNGT